MACEYSNTILHIPYFVLPVPWGGSRLHSPILGLLDDQLSDVNFPDVSVQWNTPPKKGFDHQPIQRLKKKGEVLS